MTFEKCRIEPEKDQIIGVYEASYFKGIFPEERLKEYVKELKKFGTKKVLMTKNLIVLKTTVMVGFTLKKFHIF